MSLRRSSNPTPFSKTAAESEVAEDAPDEQDAVTAQDEVGENTPVNPTAEDIVRHEDDMMVSKIEEAMAEHFPAKSRDGSVTVEVDDVHVDRRNDAAKKPGEINKLRYQGRSYSVPVRGTFRLKVGDEIVDQKRLKIADHYPVIPGLNTRLIDGGLYQNKFQVRRRPGVYPYRSDRGQDRVEFNTSGGRLFQFVVDGDKTDTPTMDLFMTKGRQNIERGGYAMLRAMGVSDEKIKERWGEDLWRQNAYHVDADGNPTEKLSEEDITGLVDRVYNQLSDKNAEKVSSDNLKQAASGLKGRLGDLGDTLDRDVNRQTIGVASGRVDEEVIEESLAHLADQHTGRKRPPHRFSEKFRTMHGMPDQVQKGIQYYETANKVKNNVQSAIDEIASGGGKIQRGGEERPARVSDAVKRGLTKVRDKVTSTFKNSDLSSTTETNNILDIEGRSKEITIKGPGGIQSDHAITPETMSLHPSRIGLIDVVKTQVSAPGVTMPMASGATITEDGEIKRVAYDRKLGKVRPVSTEEIDEDGLGFPDEFEKEEKEGRIHFTPKKDKIRAAKGDDVKEMDEKDVRYVLPDPTHMFSDNTNIIPFLNHDSGPRAIMGANQMTQGLSLTEREAPLVDTVADDGQTFSRKIGERYNAKAPVSGKVKKVEDETVEIEDEDGNSHTVPLLRNFPLNQGGFLDQKPKVEEGDEVSEGDLVSSNNYTDEDGRLAVGKNLRVAYLPFDGWNYEDAIVMSESGAKKMTSESIKEKEIDYEDHDRRSPNAYNAYHRSRGGGMSSENRSKLGQDGVIKEGETVEPGEVIAVAIRPSRVESDQDIQRVRNILGGSLKETDRSLTYDGPHEGEVVRVNKGETKATIFIRTKEPFREGDKVTGRHGEKGIVSKILPDDEMLQDENGEPMDMLLDPHGVPSRANPGQVMELAAGKIAKETGERYKVRNFTPGMLDQIKKDLDKHGLSDKEDLVDPQTGRKIPQVATGYAYKAKLKHKLDKKFKARKFLSNEYGYDLDEQPVGGASVDNLTLHALIGHNARANLAEMASLKGTKNSEYWADLAAGKDPRFVAESPYSFKKMKSMIESLGVNIEKDDQNRLKMLPMTDKDVEGKSAGEMTDPGGYRIRKNSIDAVDSSIFDPSLIGKTKKNWNHVDLGEKVPNPLFDKAIARLLRHGSGTKEGSPEVRVAKGGGKGKTMKSGFNLEDVEKTYVGDVALQIGNEQYRGSEALQKALDTIDVDKTIERLEGDLKTEFEKVEKGEKKPDGSKVSRLHQTLRYAKALKENDIDPKDGYMMSKAPVMPAEFRKPTINQATGKIMMPSVNHLYRSLIAESKSLKEDRDLGLDDDQLRDNRQRLYDSFGALLGSGKRPQGQFEATGIADQIASPRTLSGTQQFDVDDSDAQGPKGGYAQSKVVKKKMEGSGRTTIIPDPDLSVDKVGLPEEAAWRMYEPFVRKRLVKERNMSPAEAKKTYQERRPGAKQMLKDEMKQRPVMTNRAPSWWAYNIMSFEPELVEADPENPVAEKALRVPNLVVNSYFGGDYDGDTMSIHVPATDKARQEAEKMKPSKHLKAPGSYNLMINPNQSMLMGMNLMTQKGEVSDDEDARRTDTPIKDYERGKVNLDDPVEYKGKKQTAGWAIVDQAVRSGSNEELTLDDMLDKIGKTKGKRGEKADVSRETLTLDKWSLEDDWLKTLIDEHPEHYAPVMSQMSRAGNIASKYEGFTVGVSDMKTMREKADKYAKEAESVIPKLSEKIAEEQGFTGRNERTDEAARVRAYSATRPMEVDGKTFKSVSQRIMDEIESADEDENAFYKMLKVGSKGKPVQIRQVLGSYGIVSDVQGRAVPTPVKNSLGDGLTTAEYFTQQHGALAGLRDRSVETSKPGDIGKQIVAGSSDLLVTEDDCGTTQGETLPTMRAPAGKTKERPNRDLVDRVAAEAVPEANLSRGDVIDGAAFSRIQSSDVDEVKVRSPLRCEAANGVCKKCFGINERGEFPEIGENVGIREGQSIVEASTKLTLKSFHTSGAAEEQLGGFEDFEEVVHLKTPTRKATIAKFDGPISRTGTVKKVEKRTGPTGDLSAHVVHLEDDETGDVKKLRVPGQRRLKVKEGDTVRNGESLTTGRRDPNEVINLGTGNEGVEEVQKDVTNNLHTLFEDIGGIGRRTAETVTAAMSSYGRVTDPGDSDFTIGDEAKLPQVRAFNKKQEERLRITSAEGRRLAESITVGGTRYDKNQKLESDDIRAIRSKKGPNFKVRVYRRPVQVDQEVHSVLNLPRVGDDWLPKLNYRHIKTELQQAGMRGDASPIHGTHPVSAYMYGKEMDKGTTPNHWRY